jgi:hypothetical protein
MRHRRLRPREQSRVARQHEEGTSRILRDLGHTAATLPGAQSDVALYRVIARRVPPGGRALQDRAAAGPKVLACVWQEEKAFFSEEKKQKTFD